MDRSTHLTSSDYEALLRLVAELAELPPDPLARRQRALQSLSKLLDARASLFAHTTFDPATGQYRLHDHVALGYDPAEQPLLAQYFAGQSPLDPCGSHMESITPRTADVTRLRRDLIPDAPWYTSDHYNLVRTAFRLDDAVYSRVIGPHNAVFGCCFLRPKGDRPFTNRHREILHTFNLHAKSLYRLDQPLLPASPLDRLAPRLRPVAQRFLAGDSVKEAARHLRLSPHTITEYAKAIYRTFNVSSRTELLIALLRQNPPPPQQDPR